MPKHTPESTIAYPTDAYEGERQEPRYEIFSEKFKRYLQAYKELVESHDAAENIDAYHKNRYTTIRPDDPLLANLREQDRELSTVVALLIQNFLKEGKPTDAFKNLLENAAPYQTAAPMVITQEGLIKKIYATKTDPRTNKRIVDPVREDDAFAIITPYELINGEIRNFANAVIGLADYRASIRNTDFKEEDLTVPEIKNLALAPDWELEEWK